MAKPIHPAAWPAALSLSALTMLAAPQAPAQGTTDPQDTRLVATESREPFGRYLVGSDGQPLYLFTTDTQATDGTEPRITCTSEACLQAWPPYTTPDLSETPPGTPDSGANHALLSQIPQADGSFVVTYNGWPLYTYAQDRPGEAPAGQDIESFGGEWYLVSPEGEAIHAEE